MDDKKKIEELRKKSYEAFLERMSLPLGIRKVTHDEVLKILDEKHKK